MPTSTTSRPSAGKRAVATLTESRASFWGYRRENGRVGVRNHVIVLPVDDLSNAAARSGRAQRQGHAGDPASLRPAAVRRRPRSAFPHADRRRQQPERRRGRRHRHRGPMDQEGRRRHRRDRQAGRRLRHRAARRPRHDHAGVEGGARIPAVGEREAARRVRAQGALGIDQVRRIRHDLGLRRQSRPSATRSTSSMRPAARWCSARRPSSPAASRSSPRAAATTRCARSSCACSTATRRSSTATRPPTCRIRSRPRATSPAG